MYDKLLNMVLGTFFFHKQQFRKIVVIKNKTFQYASLEHGSPIFISQEKRP
jgi:hypothetical protein